MGDFDFTIQASQMACIGAQGRGPQLGHLLSLRFWMLGPSALPRGHLEKVELQIYAHA